MRAHWNPKILQETVLLICTDGTTHFNNPEEELVVWNLPPLFFTGSILSTWCNLQQLFTNWEETSNLERKQANVKVSFFFKRDRERFPIESTREVDFSAVF